MKSFARCFALAASVLLSSRDLCMVDAFVVPNGCAKNSNNCNHLPTYLWGTTEEQQQQDSSKDLIEKAAALRREIEEFEASKELESKKLKDKAKAVQKEKENLRWKHSAIVPILKPDGSVEMERCDFPPRMVVDTTTSSSSSTILAVQAALPLGIVLGQEDPVEGFRMPPITVDDLAEGSNGAKAGIQIGDILRACTACQVTMEQPTWQLMAGGIGRPKTTRMMASTDDKPFEEVMETIASNAMDPESREVWLVLERKDDTSDNQ